MSISQIEHEGRPRSKELTLNAKRFQNYMVDARLMHMAAGFNLAEKIRNGDFP